MRFQKAVHRVRCREHLLPEWLVNVLQAHAGMGLLSDYFTGTGIAHLTGVSLARGPIPLPPIEEQAEIVRLVELLWTYANNLSHHVTVAQKRIGQSSRAVLAKAFRGELVSVGTGHG